MEEFSRLGYPLESPTNKVWFEQSNVAFRTRVGDHFKARKVAQGNVSDPITGENPKVLNGIKLVMNSRYGNLLEKDHDRKVVVRAAGRVIHVGYFKSCKGLDGKLTAMVVNTKKVAVVHPGVYWIPIKNIEKSQNVFRRRDFSWRVLHVVMANMTRFFCVAGGFFSYYTVTAALGWHSCWVALDQWSVPTRWRGLKNDFRSYGTEMVWAVFLAPNVKLICKGWRSWEFGPKAKGVRFVSG